MLYTNIFQSQQFAPKRLVIITLRPCKNGNRYVICNTGTEIVIENAQGHGFSSFEKAENFALSHGWLAINKPETPESTRCSNLYVLTKICNVSTKTNNFRK